MTLRSSSLIAVVVAAAALAACHGDPHARATRAMQRGDDYHAHGKYAEAAIEYRRALQAEPGNAAAHAHLARNYVDAGEPLKAYAEFARAAELDDSNLDAEVQAGNLLLMTGDYDAARSRADLVIGRDARYAPAYVLRGNALAGLNEPGRAIRDMERALAIDPDNARAYTSMGQAQSAAGRLDAARASLEKAVALAPASVDARLALANFLWASHDLAGAERELQQALTLGGHVDLVHRALALFYLQGGRAAEAEPHFRALAGTPDGALALADYYTGVGRLEDALRAAESVRSPARAERDARIRIAAVRQRQGKTRDALAIADGLLKEDAHDVDARLLRARLLLASGQPDAAQQEARRAAGDDPASAVAFYTVGLAAMARRDTAAAEDAFQKTLSLNPRATAAEIRLAQLRLARGDVDGAVSAAAGAAAARPGDPGPAVLLARARRAAGDLDGARRELQGLTADTSDVEVERGLIALAAGRIPEARAAVDRALAAAPRDEAARGAAISLDLAAGDVAAARQRADGWLSAGQDAGTLLLAARVDLAAHEDATAERRLLDAMHAAPERPDGYELLAMLYARQGNVTAAVQRYREAAAREPDPTGPLTKAGMLLESAHDLAGARAQYETVLKRDPRAGVAANNLAYLLANSGDLENAARWARAAVDALRGRPEPHDTLGYVYLKMGRASDASAAFAWALTLAPGNATYLAHAAAARQALAR